MIIKSRSTIAALAVVTAVCAFAVPGLALAAGPAPSMSAAGGIAEAREDVAAAPLVRVRHVRVSSNGRVLTGLVAWNKAMLRRGGRSRLNAHLVARKGSQWKELYKSRNPYGGGPTTRWYKIRLSRASGQFLRQADEAHFTVTQQHASRKAQLDPAIYSWNAVTVVSVPVSGRAWTAAAATPRAAVGGRDCSGVVIKPGANLSDCNLTAALLSNANLQDADLRDSTLDGGTITNANFDRAKFDRASLTHANFNKSSFANAVMPNVKLTLSQFLGANLSSADLTNADAEMVGLGPDNSGARTPGIPCRIDPRLYCTNLNNAKLTGANLTMALAWGVYLNSADLSYVRASRAVFDAGTFNSAQFVAAFLTEASFNWYTDLQLANFTAANLTGADWRVGPPGLDGTTFTNAICPNGSKFESGGNCETY